MTISADADLWMNRIGELTPIEENARERLCNAAFDELNDRGLKPRTDDRAVEFEAAIIRWLIQCRD